MAKSRKVVEIRSGEEPYIRLSRAGELLVMAGLIPEAGEARQEVRHG